MLALFVLAGCGKAEQKTEKAAATATTNTSVSDPLRLSADDVRRAGLKVERLEPTETAVTIAAAGTIVANRNRLARVVPPVEGRLAQIRADLGEPVHAGQTLAVLESASLGEARSAYQQARIERDIAKTSLDRVERLVQEGSSARKELLRAKGDYERAEAILDAASAKLANLGVPARDTSGTSPAAFAVRAPFAGIVVEKTAVLGEYTKPYQPLFTIGDLSSVWIETYIYDRDIGAVSLGAPATVSVDAYPGQRFRGTVSYISSLLDKETHTAKARIEVANPNGYLKPRMFVNVRIEKSTKRPVLRVPENALVLLQGQMTAFVAKGDGFAPEPVETGERGDGWVVVKSGLEPGDGVVVSGAYALKARLLKSQISAD